MRDVALKFLTGVLGTEGARALARTAEREPALAAVLVPRTALAWLRDLQKHEGTLPGVETSYLTFTKSEVGYGGLISVNGSFNYEFAGVGAEHVAAAIAVAVGTVGPSNPAVRDLTLTRLGKSIDALARAQQLCKTLPQALKAELPGTTAKPVATGEPQGPQEPQKQPRQARPKPKLPKLPALKVEKSEVHAVCPECDRSNFDVNQKFQACLCWRDLAKHVRTTVYGDGVVLEFGSGFPAGAWPELRKALKGDR